MFCTPLSGSRVTHKVAVRYGRGIETRRRHRHRQRVEPARRIEIVAGDDDFLARRRRHGDRRNRMIDRRQPGFADLLDLAAHADGVDLRRRRQRADHDRNVVFAALGVGDVGEDEGAALVLRHAADELPAHQRMQLGVLVDRGVDARRPGRRLRDRRDAPGNRGEGRCGPNAHGELRRLGRACDVLNC